MEISESERCVQPEGTDCLGSHDRPSLAAARVRRTSAGESQTGSGQPKWDPGRPAGPAPSSTAGSLASEEVKILPEL